MNKRSTTDIEAMESPWGVYSQPTGSGLGLFMGAYDDSVVDPGSSRTVEDSLRCALERGLIELQSGTYLVKALSPSAPVAQITVSAPTNPVWTVKRGA